ncbi:DsbA family protein [Nocardia panacis]|uniref:DsbA family protein n=1 Tax=Nocardia panacis TaxID=2340916 RepID=A0A3A4KDH4_9NOCA|nr:DsbA family protein [Nocardia panacis]RJO70925.1 DsbA family protein [Nocardia panacis]
MTVKMTYVFDAYCGWCHGFGPTVTEFAAANADRIDLEVLSGGLFTGSRVAPMSAMPYIPEANDRIAALTGAEFGPGYQKLVADGRFAMDSTAAAAGFAALRAAAPERALASAEAMQRAFYRDGLSLSDLATYRRIADENGLDARRVLEFLNGPQAATTARHDFSRAAQLGVTAFPTLLLHTPTGVVRLGGPAADATRLTAALDRQISNN